MRLEIGNLRPEIDIYATFAKLAADISAATKNLPDLPEERLIDAQILEPPALPDSA